MALGILGIIYMVLIALALIIQVFLYKGKNESKNSIFIINMLFGIFLSYLLYTSLPTNFTEQRILALLMGGLAILAVVLKLKSEKLILVSKVMLSVSILASFIQLFL